MSDQLNIVKLSKEVSDFIETNGNKQEDLYHFPFYFKKVGDCLFEITQWNELNGELKHLVERSEPLGPDPNDEIEIPFDEDHPE